MVKNSVCMYKIKTFIHLLVSITRGTLDDIIRDYNYISINSPRVS